MLNEFRQNLVSGEWVLFATGRTHSLRKHEENKYQPKESCPFEDSNISQQYTIWKYPDKDNWFATLIKNKYPAVVRNLCAEEKQFGPFKTFDAIGDHEVIVYRDHDKSIFDFSIKDMEEVVKIYKRRFNELAKESECTKYIMIFHNNGISAGASIFHSHSQIITTPILSPDISRSIYGSYQYYQKNKKRVYTELLEWELKEKTRIVYENEHFVVFCPYVSKYPYEVRVFSKESHAHFNQLVDNLDVFYADAIYTTLQKMKIVLDFPSFNMFIHTAPIINDLEVHTHDFYHWHTEIVPHLKIDAGFELGTGIEINIMDPDESAEALRNAKI